MRGDFEKQFLDEQKSHFRSLRGMVQKKHQIRINFTHSKAYLQLVRMQQEPTTPPPQPPNSLLQAAAGFEREASVPRTQEQRIDSKIPSSRVPTPYLYEVVERGRSKIRSFGTSPESFIAKSPNISRSYRRKRNVSLTPRTI